MNNKKTAIWTAVLAACLGLAPIANAIADPVQPNQRSNVPVDHSNASTVYKNLPRTIGSIQSVAVLVEGKTVAYMSDSEPCLLQTTRPHSQPLEGLKFYTLWQGQDNLYRGEGCVAKDEDGRLLSLAWAYPRDSKGFTRPYGQRFEFIRADWTDAPAFLSKEVRRK